MGVANQLAKLGADLASHGKGAGNAFMGMFGRGGNSAAAAELQAAYTGKSLLGHVGSAFGWVGGKIGGGAAAVAKGSAGLAVRVIEAPLAAGIWGVRQGVKGVGTAFTKAPKTMWGLTGILGVAGVGSIIASRNEARSNAYYQQQLATIQQQQQNPYRLQAGEYTQNVAPYLKDSANGGANFADAEAQRAAASQNAAGV